MNVTIRKAKIWKSGGSYVITVPIDFIQNDLIDINKEYQIEVCEIESDDTLKD
ncbi:MAG: hypothetical protein ACP5N3_04105 [Candidatus Nanoarchaeia archaeon]